MGLLYKYDYEIDDHRPTTQDEKVARVIGVGIAVLIAAGLFAEKGVDILGDKHKPVSIEQAEKKAVEKYGDAFNRASPAGKFVLQYLTTTRVAIPDNDSSGHGPLAWFQSRQEQQYQVELNNACLSQTAYDIAGGSMKGEANGLFSSARIEGKMPTAAAYALVDGGNTDRLIVKSGHDDSVDLRFKGLEGDGPLIPADAQTRNIVDTTNECNLGVVGSTRLSVYKAEQSPYIH